MTPNCIDWFLRKSTGQLISKAVTAPGKFYGQAERAISTRKLQALLLFHIEPIKHVIFVCPSFPFWVGRFHLESCFPLLYLQRLSQPYVTTQPYHIHAQLNTRASSFPVPSYHRHSLSRLL